MTDNFLDRLIKDKILVDFHLDDKGKEDGKPVFFVFQAFLLDYTEHGFTVTTLNNEGKSFNIWFPKERLARITLSSES